MSGRHSDAISNADAHTFAHTDTLTKPDANLLANASIRRTTCNALAEHHWRRRSDRKV